VTALSADALRASVIKATIARNICRIRPHPF
jgi:hypothetical protein